MKRPLNPPVPAVVGNEGSFVELAFPPFELSGAEFRPVWAERGKMRKAWDSLSEIERRVVLRLLEVKIPRPLGADARPATALEVKKHKRSCLMKLGCTNAASLAKLHRESSMRFERHAWAAGTPIRT